jgi:hypothetical protein
MTPHSLRTLRIVLGVLNLTLAAFLLAGSFIWDRSLRMELRAFAVGGVLIGVGCLLNARATRQPR